jgi:hypothetical protein
VTEGRVVVSGRAEPGSIVTVNGVVVPLQGDRFSRNVTLSGGDNVLVVRAEDGAGNAAEERFAVAFTAPAGSPATGIGLAVAGIVIAAVIAFLLGRRFLFPPATGPTEEGEPQGGGTDVETAPVDREAKEAATTLETAGTDRVDEPSQEAPLEMAEPELQEYEAALKDLETFEAEVSPVPVTEDPRVTKLREAYESGKISRGVYEANLARLQKTG